SPRPVSPYARPPEYRSHYNGRPCARQHFKPCPEPDSVKYFFQNAGLQNVAYPSMLKPRILKALNDIVAKLISPYRNSNMPTDFLMYYIFLSITFFPHSTSSISNHITSNNFIKSVIHTTMMNGSSGCNDIS